MFGFPACKFTMDPTGAGTVQSLQPWTPSRHMSDKILEQNYDSLSTVAGLDRLDWSAISAIPGFRIALLDANSRVVVRDPDCVDISSRDCCSPDEYVKPSTCLRAI